LVVSYQLSAVEWWALVWLMIQSMGSNAGLVWPLSRAHFKSITSYQRASDLTAVILHPITEYRFIDR